MSTTTDPISRAEWLAEGRRLFGDNFMNWRFECPLCHNVASIRDFHELETVKDAANSAACECIGRYRPEAAKPFLAGKSDTGPCDYAGYGLFPSSTRRIRMEDGSIQHCFAFGPPVETKPNG